MSIVMIVCEWLTYRAARAQARPVRSLPSVSQLYPRGILGPVLLTAPLLGPIGLLREYIGLLPSSSWRW